jgi:hypothetical protein
MAQQEVEVDNQADVELTPEVEVQAPNCGQNFKKGAQFFAFLSSQCAVAADCSMHRYDCACSLP